MFIDLNSVEIYVRPGRTDMRKQINGLSILVQEELKLNPFCGALFVFCNARRHLLKILYWDRSGFALWLKRLEKEKFPWPSNGQEARKIDVAELRMLLSGIDFWSAHKSLKYTRVC
jgi:transposase